METKTGHNGEKLKEYVKWLRERILKLKSHEGYNPVIHIDVYGTLSTVFNDDTEAIADYLGELTEMARPSSCG